MIYEEKMGTCHLLEVDVQHQSGFVEGSNNMNIKLNRKCA
jgi:hypothetical protein